MSAWTHLPPSPKSVSRTLPSLPARVQPCLTVLARRPTDSEARAHIVAHMLHDAGVECYRLTTRGWGSRVSRAALNSDDPLAQVAKYGYGWVDLFFIDDELDTEFPAHPSFYAPTLVASPPPPSSRTQPRSHPIFYMEPGARVGERVALHFFEPRAPPPTLPTATAPCPPTSTCALRAATQ